MGRAPEIFARDGRTLGARLAILSAAASLPLLVVSTLNYGHYGWFGTVEFRAAAFKDAYGALTRINVGPELPMVPVTRQMREAAYDLSPTFAELRPYLEGELGLHWADKENFAPEERQIRGGWFIWALRDAVAAAGHAHNARDALQFYRHMADELNAACEAGRVPARPPRSGFLPPLQASLLRPLWDAGWVYTRFFATFDSFTAYSRESLGDYAELKVFRDLTGGPFERGPALTRAVRATPGRTPAATGSPARRDRARPFDTFLHLAGAARGACCRRHPGWSWTFRGGAWSFPLVIAVACAAGSCLAYIAINAIVEVTSFPNKTPAALASAYPLLILAIIAVALDVWPDRRQTWRNFPHAGIFPCAKSIGTVLSLNDLAIAGGISSPLPRVFSKKRLGEWRICAPCLSKENGKARAPCFPRMTGQTTCQQRARKNPDHVGRPCRKKELRRTLPSDGGSVRCVISPGC